MGKRVTDFSPEAMEMLMDYDWPGNVRELSNAIERAMVVGTPPVIRPEDLPVRTHIKGTACSGDSLAEIEKRHIAAILERVNGNVTEAADVLKVDRATVYNKIKKYGLRE
jgi:DNA-binding NtrC family response regulator